LVEIDWAKIGKFGKYREEMETKGKKLVEN